MLIQLRENFLIERYNIVTLSLLPAPTPERPNRVLSMFRLRSLADPVYSYGNWAKKIVEADSVRAVFLTRDHYDLRK